PLRLRSLLHRAARRRPLSDDQVCAARSVRDLGGARFRGASGASGRRDRRPRHPPSPVETRGVTAMTVPIDYETLRIVWWALIGVLLIGFAIFDGFALGTAILLPFLGRTDTERRLLINSVGPVWEGNQVWFILAGGASFAAWPPLYAAAFSGFYLAM